MNSVQESKQELEAAIRYAENAISSANKTIESMEFRQEMAKKQSFEQTGREEALTKEVQELEERNDKLNAQIVEQTGRIAELEAQVNALEQPEQPTMPVIPKAVAIAIFREGVQHGVQAACNELDMETYIRIEESEYVGDFHVTFERDIDLNEHIDTDWMRDKCGNYEENAVIEALRDLCADKEFECRIHGVDDRES